MCGVSVIPCLRFIFYWLSLRMIRVAGFSLGLDDMEGDLSPPYGGGTSIGGQSSNRGGRMGRDIYFMGGDPYFE